MNIPQNASNKKKSSPLKVLMVHNYYSQRGGEDVVFEQESELLQQRGHKVIQFSRRNPKFLAAPIGKKFAYFPQMIWSRQSRNALKNIIHQEQPEIAHIHNTFAQISPSIFSLLRQHKIPIVHTLHNFRMFCPAGTFHRKGQPCEDCLNYSLWRGIQCRCYQQSRLATAALASMIFFHQKRNTWAQDVDLYITMTEFGRNKFIQAGLPSDKLVIKPNFVSPDPGYSARKERIVLCAGRLTEGKGIEILLRAWEMLNSDRIFLWIAGDGPMRNELEEFVSQRKMSNVRFLGHLNRPDLVEIMKKASFLVFPSQMYENFPMSIVEAFACGTAVIAASSGVTREIIDPEETGWLYDSAKPRELAELLNRLSIDLDLALTAGISARRKYERLYTPTANYLQLLEIYERMTKLSQLKDS